MEIKARKSICHAILNPRDMPFRKANIELQTSENQVSKQPQRLKRRAALFINGLHYTQVVALKNNGVIGQTGSPQLHRHYDGKNLQK